MVLYSIVEDIQNDEQSNAAEKKRVGRGITKLENVFSRKLDMPKIQILLNARGQPVDESSKKFARAIGCLPNVATPSKLQIGEMVPLPGEINTRAQCLPRRRCPELQI
jgi:hypothetical protein